MKHRTGHASLAAGVLSIVLGAFLLMPARADAQPAWDAPMLLAPGAPAGWGFHLVDVDPGDGLGGLVTYRSNPAPAGAAGHTTVSPEEVSSRC